MTHAHVDDLVLSVAAALATFLVFRRSPGAALAVVLAALIASNSGVTWLKPPFLTARWAALGCVALLLVGELRRTTAQERRWLALLGIVPLVCFLSLAWSVDARLTFERAATFAALLWVAAGYGLEWRREPRDLQSFFDAVSVLAVVVVAVSVLEGLVTDDAFYAGQFRGLFENPNGIGLFLGLTYPFVAGTLERRAGRWRLPAQLAYLAACVATATDARARAGLGVLVIVAIGFALSTPRRRNALWAVAAIAVAAASTLAIAGGSLGSPTRPTTVTSTGHHSGGAKQPSGGGGSTATGPAPPTQTRFSRLTGGRSEAWGATGRLIGDRPALGYGFGTGDRIFALHPDQARFTFFQGADPSQAYLRLYLELGVLALALLVPLLGAGVLGVRLLLSRRSLEGSCCALVVLGGLAAGFVESIFATAGAPWAPLLWIAAAGCVACRWPLEST
jgi:hypothetical protein